MSLRDRIGIDIGRRLRLEDGIEWAARNAVRLADCFRNGHEVHLKPGAGDIDFGDMFRRIEAKGFTGHYTNAFGSLEDMLAAR